MKKQILMLICLAASLLSGLSAFAQSAFTVKLTLVDDSNGEPVSFATVSLTPKGATKASNYVLSDAEGNARVEKVKKGTYSLKAELMGYTAHVQEIVVDKTLNLGEIRMKTDAQLLDAASVSAVGNPIVVKKDTIEYNAASFKTTDNDMLEDLLKKLPGIEVGTDGSVTANGQTIKKITIDGKTFFLDDPSLASKNIPAKIVNKVKVVEKKSDQALFTGIDDGEEETVIDLSIRPGMMNGVFGNVMAGGGHDLQTLGMGQDARYQGAAMVGRFTDKSQLSVILNGNNTNNRGFNDMAGSMMSQMRGSRGGMGGGSNGMGGSNGITTSWLGGANGAWTLLDGNMDLAGNYLYNGTRKLVLEDSYTETYKENGDVIIRNSDGNDLTRSDGHRFGVRLEHKFNKKTSILFEPQFNFGSGSFNEYSADTTYTNDLDHMTNKGFTSNIGNNKNWSASGFLLFRQKIGEKAGRTFSVMTRYDFSGNKLDGFNQSLVEVLDNGTGLWGGDPTNQRYHTVSNGSSASVRAVYTEPLAEKLFLEVNYSYSWSMNKSVKDVFNSGAFDSSTFANTLDYINTGETRDDTYSNDIRNQYQTHTAGMNLQYQQEKFRAQLGAAFLPTITENTTNGEKYESTVYNWSPQAMLSYEFNDNANMRFFYRGRSSQPSTSQLMPVPDNSNPLSISFGNPYLTPYFSHNLRGMFGFTNKQTFFSLHAHMNASIVQNTIVNASWYDGYNVAYAMPVNGGTTGNFNLGAFVTVPIAKSNFSIQNMLNFGLTGTEAFVGVDSKKDEFTARYYDSANASFDYKQFNTDFFQHGQAASAGYDFEDYFIDNKTNTINFTERLKFTYRNDFVELSLSGRTRVNKSWYTIVTENTVTNPTWNNQVSGEMLWTIPGGLGLNSECRYNWYNGYKTPQQSTVVINAEITKLLFKNKFTLSVKAYDLLNQSKNLYVSDSGNIHTETRNNTLGRYVMVSLTYRFGNFNKAGQQMGRGGRGPMGPPPGR